MILKKLAVKCDNCKTSEVTSIIKCFKSYGAKCKVCGHIPLLDEKDVVLLAFLVIASFFLSPVNWLWKKITGQKNIHVKIESDDGVTYKCKKPS